RCQTPARSERSPAPNPTYVVQAFQACRVSGPARLRQGYGGSAEASREGGKVRTTQCQQSPSCRPSERVKKPVAIVQQALQPDPPSLCPAFAGLFARSFSTRSRIAAATRAL